MLVLADGTRFKPTEPLRWVAILRIEHQIFRHTIRNLAQQVKVSEILNERTGRFDEIKERARQTLTPDLYWQGLVIGGELDTSQIDLTPIVTGEEIKTAGVNSGGRRR